MSVSSLTAQSPFAARLFAWIKERFPPAIVLLVLPLYGGTVAMAQLATRGRVHFELVDVFGALACTAFFLLLRVFDEHKDYDIDCVNHPKRVLQRGLVTLDQLKVVGGVALAIQLAASLWADGGLGGATLCWAVVLGWSLLMAKEFFAGEWLKPRLVLYATSHMLIMPLAVVWLMHLGSRGASIPWELPLWYGALVFFLGATGEVARKLKAPEDEAETVDSYTKSLGVRGAALLVFALGTAAIALQLKVVALFAGRMPGWGWWVPSGLALLLVAAAASQFATKPSAKAAKGVEGAAVGALLILYWVPLVAALRLHDVSFF